MKIRIVILALLVVTGCTPAPRYYSGGAEQPHVKRPNRKSYTTNEYLRLGGILQSYLGKPYLGKSRYEKGVDCSLLIQEVFKKFDGRVIPRTVAEQNEIGRLIHRNHLRYGDLVFFRTGRTGVSHVGVYVGHNEFIHASLSSGVMVSSLSEKYWSECYISARRILEKTPKEDNRSRYR